MPKVSATDFKTSRLKKNVSLRNKTTLHIGGRAAAWFEPANTDELISFLKSPKARKPVFVIGAGSNLLAGDGVVKKTFIHLSAPEFCKVSLAGRQASVGAGLRLHRFISILSTRDLTGYEFLAGIPGTVGGALVMNAGAQSCPGKKGVRKDIGSLVSWVDVLDSKGRLSRLKKKDIKFLYRASSLKPYVILGAGLILKKGKKAQARAIIKGLMEERWMKQEHRYFSAGSFFKNPGNGPAAGRLIDACGLKGLRVGGAMVSLKHANFIVNVRRAQSRDVRRLMEIIQKKVYNRFKIKLTPEVEIVA